MKFRRMAALLLALTLLLAGCGRQRDEKKYTVVAAVFPAYDWAREILGDCTDVELILLSDKGVDLHSYQATAEDMVLISQCDLFLYVGGESDEWVDAVLASVPNDERCELALLDALEDRLFEEETVEGMQVRGQEEEESWDEHVWLSLRNARILTGAIAEALCEMAPEYESVFTENAAAYDTRLKALDDDFTDALAGSGDTLMFCDRFPFRYLTEDYGLNYYAAFSGCSGDSEASFATVLFLAEKAEELGLHVFLQLEDSDRQLARTVEGCTPGVQEILTLDSMQSVSLEDARSGVTYLQLMTQNLSALKRALEKE